MRQKRLKPILLMLEQAFRNISFATTVSVKYASFSWYSSIGKTLNQKQTFKDCLQPFHIFCNQKSTGILRLFHQREIRIYLQFLYHTLKTRALGNVL